MLNWHAHDSSKAVGRTREPVIGESFAGIEERAHSLLREAIQNSLDARADTQKPVRIRIYLSEEAGALSATDAAAWFASAWPHIEADPTLGEFDRAQKCAFLALEDFNTVGLQGDLAERAPDEGSKNAWCLFFRKEGQSAKSETERGRWGVGKVVFPLCSAAHAFLAATIRADDHKRLVMGQAMLRSRRIGALRYLPDLWYCLPPGPDTLELPSSDPTEFDALRSTFKLERELEPGLSVVIPYVDPSITREALVTGVIKEFFFPILTRTLTVDIVTHSAGPLSLTQSTLPTFAATLRGGPNDLLYQIAELARWSIESPDPPITASSPPIAYGFEWSDEQLSRDQLSELKAKLGSDQPAHLRIPMPVLLKNGQQRDGHFDVVLRTRAESATVRPTFVRSDLVIPEVKGRAIKGFTAVVIAQEKTVSTLLGDAENPAHTDWSKHSSNFAPKYKYPTKHLDYVKHASWNLCRLLGNVHEKVAERALIDFFSLPVDDGAPVVTGGPSIGSGGPPPPPIRPLSKPKPFRVVPCRGGYTVHSTSTPLPSGKGILIECAYAIRRGNALKKFHPADFDVSKLGVVLQGVRQVQRSGNSILVTPTTSTFSVRVEGFDENRDLLVRAREMQAPQ